MFWADSNQSKKFELQWPQCKFSMHIVMRAAPNNICTQPRRDSTIKCNICYSTKLCGTITTSIVVTSIGQMWSRIGLSKPCEASDEPDMSRTPKLAQSDCHWCVVLRPHWSVRKSASHMAMLVPSSLLINRKWFQVGPGCTQVGSRWFHIRHQSATVGFKSSLTWFWVGPVLAQAGSKLCPG